jgi:hypothetical protein
MDIVCFRNICINTLHKGDNDDDDDDDNNNNKQAAKSYVHIMPIFINTNFVSVIKIMVFYNARHI